jgi:hypothetical protein
MMARGNGLFLEKDRGLKFHGPLAAFVHGGKNLGNSGGPGSPYALPDIQVVGMLYRGYYASVCCVHGQASLVGRVRPNDEEDWQLWSAA